MAIESGRVSSILCWLASGQETIFSMCLLFRGASTCHPISSSRAAGVLSVSCISSTHITTIFLTFSHQVTLVSHRIQKRRKESESSPQDALFKIIFHPHTFRDVCPWSEHHDQLANHVHAGSGYTVEPMFPPSPPTYSPFSTTRRPP